MFAAAVAGWVVAIPLNLKMNNVSGWRFWLYLGIGQPRAYHVFVAILAPVIKNASRIGQPIMHPWHSLLSSRLDFLRSPFSLEP